MLLIISVFGLVSCVKQKNCDCGFTGTWQYLEVPYDIKVTSGATKKIVAEIVDSDYGGYIWISGSVPKEFKSLTRVGVDFCVEYIGDTKHKPGGPPVYKLLCIEKVN